MSDQTPRRVGLARAREIVAKIEDTETRSPEILAAMAAHATAIAAIAAAEQQQIIALTTFTQSRVFETVLTDEERYALRARLLVMMGITPPPSSP